MGYNIETNKEPIPLIHLQNRSLFIGFLILMVIPLMIALPPSGTVETTLEFGFDLKTVFLYAFALCYGILALNLGQGEIGRWVERGKDVHRDRVYLRRLLAQCGVAMVLTAPYWIIFHGVTHLGLGRVLGSAVHLFIYGIDLALVGFALGARVRSESAQLMLKYGGFAGYLTITLFHGQVLNPFLIASSILTRGFDRFILISFIVFAGVGALLIFLIRKMVSNMDDESGDQAHEVSV